MVITLMLSALGFIVAFQWRDVIKETIELFLPPGEGLIYKWGVALAFTLLAAGLAIVLVKVQRMDIIPDKYEPQKRLVHEIRKRRKSK